MNELIHPVWFEGLHWSLLLLFTAVSMAALIKGADGLVEGASGLAYRIGMPKIIIGATIVSLGTTSPEAAVSVMAAWGGDSGLALGNAVGSVIADTGLIFGIGCLLVCLPADRFVLTRQGWVQFGAAVLLALVCYCSFALYGDRASIGRWVGIFFLALLVGYLFLSVKWARMHRHGEPFQAPNGIEEAVSTLTESDKARPITRGVLFLLGIILVGLILVVFSSHVLICSVRELAVQMTVPPVVIAATLVAFGTSLPELVVGITAIRKKHPELLVGNVIGADILNVFFVIGASAAAAELPVVDSEALVPRIFLYVHLPTMLVILILFRIFIAFAVKKGQFARWFGVPLVVIYVVYVVLQYALSLD